MHGSDQPSPEFRVEIVAPEADVDMLGHISNVAFVRWIQDVATTHSEAVGYDQARYRALGGVFVVRRHELDYLRPAYAGERIALITHVAWWKGATTERRTRVVRADDGTSLVRAATLWAYVSFDTGKPRRIPLELRDAFYGDAPARVHGGANPGAPERSH